MDALIATFLTWIVAQTGLAQPDHPPQIVMMQKERMAALYYGTDTAATSSSLIAFYNHPNSTIYLPDTWSAATLRDQSVLLHELVHHVQRYNNVRGPCPGAIERQAYDLQMMWLREQGVQNPYEIIGTNEFTVIVRTSCLQMDDLQ